MTTIESEILRVARSAGSYSSRVVALLLLGGVSASAQEDAALPAPVAEEPARYTVELIVFAYEDASSAGNEVFTPPDPLPDPLSDKPFDATAPGGELEPGTASEEGPVFDDRTPEGIARTGSETMPDSGPLRELPARARIELERLEPEAFGMQDTWRRLQRLDAYRPLLHAAWTQTTHEKAVSPTLPLRALSDPPLGLDGSISLYQSRFLHLDVDLTLDASSPAGRDTRRTATDRLVNPDATPDADETSGAPGDRPRRPTRYRITEDRIMRDGDVRYFDHPRFGMLARVSRVEPEDPPPL